jgi:hypothetical protein
MWTYVGGVPAVGVFMFGQYLAVRSKVSMKDKEGHFCRTEYLLLKARHEVHPALVLRPSCVPEKKWM